MLSVYLLVVSMYDYREALNVNEYAFVANVRYDIS